MIQLKNVTTDNIFKVIELTKMLDENQQKSVASNVLSLAQAYVNLNRAWPQAIYLEDEPIGFVMLALHDEDIPEVDQPAYYLWRFMIAKPYQTKGYGKQVLDLIYQKCQEENIKYLYTSCTMHSPMPYQFYINYGFIDTKEMDDDEEILKLEIK